MSIQSLIYPTIAVLAGISTLLIIPKKRYKHFFLYGLIFGALGDTISVLIFSKVFHLFQYRNMGLFNVFNIFSLWTPITWLFVFMLFFYFMPVRKIFLFPYLLAFIALNFAVGPVMEALGLMQAKHGVIYWFFEFGTFSLWFSIAAWVYLKNREIPLK